MVHVLRGGYLVRFGAFWCAFCMFWGNEGPGQVRGNGVMELVLLSAVMIVRFLGLIPGKGGGILFGVGQGQQVSCGIAAIASQQVSGGERG